ncbi:LysM peptidoglycan-binding domain-containing protein [Cohnella fermenti]|uniref:LysM peptidoglycan-binding domain-containing protein n=1 Tax=Cohnella fermenti TaxID=2565925 RepID=A0A4S4BT12_9BACL|nr:LysM peptidoglycan-binding domain-containing protein [Cohnella fermenti]THF78024.1 LysM peptidoglycan-binding domain-containing protein [Cohnella fermenti]
MDIYLIDDTDKFHFPVNPEEIAINREKQYETFQIISLGEVDMAQQSKIKEISFSSFFPQTEDSSYCRYTGIPDPQLALQKLITLLVAKKPVRLLITETKVNVLVFVASVNTVFRGGEPGDISFDITFRTWREMKVKKAGAEAAGASAVRSDTKAVPKIYVVKAGDTLSAIAKRELGSSSKWSVIYERNKAVIGKDPNLIRVGQKLVMP